MAFPHATPGYIPSPLQSPYFAAAAAANPLAHINPAIMFPTAVTSAVTEPQSVAMVNTTDSSRSVQMQAALLQQAVPGQFHAAAAQAAAQAATAHHPQPHHPQLQLQHQQQQQVAVAAQKANKADRAAEVRPLTNFVSRHTFVVLYSLHNSHVFDRWHQRPQIQFEFLSERQMGKLHTFQFLFPLFSLCPPKSSLFVCSFVLIGCPTCFVWMRANRNSAKSYSQWL